MGEVGPYSSEVASSLETRPVCGWFVRSVDVRTRARTFVGVPLHICFGRWFVYRVPVIIDFFVCSSLVGSLEEGRTVVSHRPCFNHGKDCEGSGKKRHPRWKRWIRAKDRVEERVRAREKVKSPCVQVTRCSRAYGCSGLLDSVESTSVANGASMSRGVCARARF